MLLFYEAMEGCGYLINKLAAKFIMCPSVRAFVEKLNNKTLLICHIK